MKLLEKTNRDEAKDFRMNHLFTYQKYIIYISLKFYYPGHKKKYFKRLPLIYQKFPKKSYSMNDTVCHSHRRGTGLVIPTGPFFIFFFKNLRYCFSQLLPSNRIKQLNTNRFITVSYCLTHFYQWTTVMNRFPAVGVRFWPC